MLRTVSERPESDHGGWRRWVAGSLRKAEGIIHGDKAILGKRWNLSKAAAGHTTDFQKLAVRTGDIHGAETRPPPVSRSRDGLAWDSCCPGLGGCAHISRYPRSSRCVSLLYRPGMLRTNKWLIPQTCFLPPSHRGGSKMDLEVTFLNWPPQMFSHRAALVLLPARASSCSSRDNTLCCAADVCFPPQAFEVMP